MKLTQSGSTWTLTDSDDTIETYTTAGALGMLDSIKARSGYTQTLTYSGSQLAMVADSFSRSLTFTYSGNALQKVTTPDSLVLTYGFSGTGASSVLTSVGYNTNPVTSQTYFYANSSFPFALTSITDETGNAYTSWAYDAYGRVTSSQHAGGADLTQVSYDDNTGNRTVTKPLGEQETYKFTTLQGVSKVTEIDRHDPSGSVPDAKILRTYDTSGYLSSQTDWRGNKTTYVNDNHGQPTMIVEVAGSSVARTTTIAYDTTWVHEPAAVATPGLTTTYTYEDGTGNPLTKTLTDTTTATAPYVTKGQARTSAYSWGNYGLLASAKGPRTDVNETTSYIYDSSGALTKTTDAAGHATAITSHSGGGRPQTIVDPNGVTTNLTYDVRQRLTNKTLTTAAGALTTAFTYDSAGNLLSTTLPDGSSLANTYDTAHRLTKVTDGLGNYTSYTLDAVGDRTNTSIYKVDGTLTWQRSGTFDTLGRELIDTSGTGQTTTRTYDANGNTLTIADGMSQTTSKVYDALNRLRTSTDSSGGVTTSSYDAHDRIVNVKDANGNSTAYLRDGFGDVIQQTSPDSGAAVYHYDAAGNLTSKTDALGIVTNQTFDALNRPLTTTYPTDTAENVAYTYDQTGTGFAFGVGRLTGVSDAAGSLTRTYDERGNLITEKRVSGTAILTTGYAYDGASRVASMTYPDGTQVAYQHDAAGYVSTVNAKPAGSSATTTLATLNHQPFGPLNGAAFGNGVVETWAFDTGYRPTAITDVLNAAGVQNLTYAYDKASNVTTITDGINAANSQTFGYDAVNRLTSATGGYGSLSWTYDNVGNRLTQVQGATTTTYGYTAGTNRLATITFQTAQARLEGARPISRLHGSDGALARAALATRGLTPQTKHTFSTGPPRSTRHAGFLGWPLIAVGFTGILAFRRRLLTHRLLAVLIYASLLTGSAVILNGCVNHLTSAVPSFSPGTGSYTGAQAVAISDATPAATIYYTTDGTTPTNRSAQYSGPISVAATETIKAFAVANNFSDSAVASATYTIAALPVATAPAISPATGSYSSPIAVTITDTTAGAAIYYTTDGTTPTTGSSPYTGPLQVTSTKTVSAIAVATGYANSVVASATYTISALPVVAAPTFTPAAGGYPATQTVTISDATVGATIYYTVNGTGPTTSSTPYTGPIVVSTSQTIAAIATASGYAASPVAKAAYTITLPVAAPPTFSPAAGAFTGTQTVAISDTTAGAAIYYTLDGTLPTVGGARYSGPLTVSSTATIQAIAVASGYTNSPVAIASYTINQPVVGTPTFSPLPGTFTGTQSVTISDATPSAAIYYTVDGSTPTVSAAPYAGPITVSSPETISAIAVASGYANSSVAKAAYNVTLQPAASPTFTPPAGTFAMAQAVTLSDATPGATIYYTVDGTTPTSGSSVYSTPVTVAASETLKAVATASGYAASAAASAAYIISTAGVTVRTNANGNITSIPPANSAAYATFGYNNANRLASVTESPMAASFVYDWAGQRFSKTNNGTPPTIYSYSQDGSVISENDNGTITDYVYVDGRPIAIVQPGATPAANQINYVAADRLGTPQTVTNSSGQTVWRAAYQPFGTTAGTDTASLTQNLRFPGQLADGETGFSYNLNRDYMPNLGRYLESDPIGLRGGQASTYVYVHNQPLRLTDPYGLENADPSEVPDKIDQLNTVIDTFHKANEDAANAVNNPAYVDLSTRQNFTGNDELEGLANSFVNATNAAAEICEDAAAIISPAAAKIVDQINKFREAAPPSSSKNPESSIPPSTSNQSKADTLPDT